MIVVMAVAVLMAVALVHVIVLAVQFATADIAGMLAHMARACDTAAMIVLTRMMVLVTAPAVVLLAQAADVSGILAALGHLVHHIGLDAVAAHREHCTAQRLVDARVLTQCADDQVRRHAGDKRDQDLQPQDLEEQAGVDALGHQHGQHLIGRREEDRHQRTQRDHPAGIQRCRHGGKAALRNHAQQRTGHRTRSARTTHDGVGTRARGMFERFERQIRHE